MSSETPNLDDLTFEYLMSPRQVIRERLIRYGHAIVHPLLHSLVRYISAYGASIKSERERERIKEYEWAELIFNPLLRPAHDLIFQMGEIAIYQLCKAVRQFDRRVQKAATLLLALQATEDVPGVRTMTEIRDVLWKVGINDTATVMLLTVMLARGGDARCQQAIAEHARDNRMDVGEWTMRTLDTAVLELLGWEQETQRR